MQCGLIIDGTPTIHIACVNEKAYTTNPGFDAIQPIIHDAFVRTAQFHGTIEYIPPVALCVPQPISMTVYRNSHLLLYQWEHLYWLLVVASALHACYPIHRIMKSVGTLDHSVLCMHISILGTVRTIPFL